MLSVFDALPHVHSNTLILYMHLQYVLSLRPVMHVMRPVLILKSCKLLNNCSNDLHASMPVLPQQNIHAAFEALGERVNSALRTQIGDAARLNAHQDDCLRLYSTVGQVSSHMSFTCSQYP